MRPRSQRARGPRWRGRRERPVPGPRVHGRTARARMNDSPRRAHKLVADANGWESPSTIKGDQGWLSPQRRCRERTLPRRAGRPERRRNRRSHTQSGGCHHDGASAASHRCAARNSLLSGRICSNAARDLARSAFQLQPFFGLQAAARIAFAKDVTAALSMVRRDWSALEGILGASPCQGMLSDPDLADGQRRRSGTARSSQSGSRLPARPPA